MIVDVHSHTWSYPSHFNDDFREQAKKALAGTEVDLAVRYEEYAASASKFEVAKTVVFGGKARLSGLWVDDAFVARYVAEHPDRLMGFLSVDPTQDGWQEEMRHGPRRRWRRLCPDTWTRSPPGFPMRKSSWLTWVIRTKTNVSR